MYIDCDVKAKSHIHSTFTKTSECGLLLISAIIVRSGERLAATGSTLTAIFLLKQSSCTERRVQNWRSFPKRQWTPAQEIPRTSPQIDEDRSERAPALT